MKYLPSFAFITAALVAALPLSAMVERTVDKTFNVSGAGTIRLETSGGSISVVPGSDGTVKITAREKIRADSDGEADAMLKDLDLKFEQNGNDIQASAKYTRSSSGFHFRSGPGVQVDFVATVPASYAADVRTSGGPVTIGDLAGNVTAHTSGGGIKLGKIGGAVEAKTSGGSITLAEANGSAKLDTSGGGINVNRVVGPADLSTSGGSIRIDSVEQKVKAHTSGGSVHAAIAGPLKGDCDLSTSGGSVDVTVDKAAAFQLDASTSGGTVRAEGLAITDEKRTRTKVTGAVNGGGPELKLRTSGGNIQVNVK